MHAVAAALVGLLASCAAAGGGSTGPTTTTTAPDPELPAIASFTVSAASAPAPALLAFRWTVTDPNGDELTCRLDADGDSIVDETLPDCTGTTSRNHAFAAPVTATALLTVSDGPHTVFATRPVLVVAGPSESFDILVRSETPFDPPVQAAFDAAEARWESVVVRGVPDRTLNLPADHCPGSEAVTTVDDLIVDAVIEPIDGVGGVLGRAGPCSIWGGDDLTRLGVMTFDSADVANMLTSGVFDEVVLHEMGHVLGVGTLWDWQRSLLVAGGSPDPRYVGSRAVAEWDVLGGAGNVPVEAGGGAGTADSHWREATFDNELMTGYIDVGANLMSAMTIASLADLGYQVDLGAADAYDLPFGWLFRIQPAPAAVEGQMLRPTRHSD
jgi:hypothetical protein